MNMDNTSVNTIPLRSPKLPQRLIPFVGKQQSNLSLLRTRNNTERWNQAFLRLTQPAAYGYDRQSLAPSLTERALDAFRQQTLTASKPASVNDRPISIYHVVIILNFVRNRQAKKELTKCKLRIQQLEEEISSLSRAVKHLTAVTTAQKLCVNRHCCLLSLHQKLFHHTILEHRIDTKRQSLVINYQQKLIQRLLDGALHRDLMIDLTLVVMTVYLSNSSLINQLLYRLLHFLHQPSAPKWFRQLSAHFLALKLYLYLRRLNVQKKIRYGVSVISLRLAQFFMFVLVIFVEVLAFYSSAFTLSEQPSSTLNGFTNYSIY